MKRGCWACRAINSGVKSRKAFTHTCELRLPVHTINKILPGMSKLDSLVKLSVDTFKETFSNENKIDLETYIVNNFNHEKLGLELCDNNNTFFLAECDSISSGYAKLRKHSNCPEKPGENSIELQRIYVSSKYQNQNIELELMLRCLTEALIEGYKSIWLCVNENNKKAIDFYLKFGFIKIGTHKFNFEIYNQKDWLMEKTFNQS